MLKRIAAWVGIIIILILFAILSVNLVKIAQTPVNVAEIERNVSDNSRVNYVEVGIMSVLAVVIITYLKYDKRRQKVDDQQQCQKKSKDKSNI